MSEHNSETLLKMWPLQLLTKGARQLGVGRAYLLIDELRALTIRGALKRSIAKGRYLTRILEARPIPAGEGAIEVHMLLHHKRIYEGIWALYSFAYFSAQPCRMVVHNDGTLTDSDIAALNRVFPKCQVISRSTADSVVLGYLDSEGLTRCAKLRRSFVFSLKLFDPFFFAHDRYFILLDSDVLFFSRPDELIEGLEAAQDGTELPNLYSVDKGYVYDLDPAELVSLLGRDCIELMNAGLLRARQGDLNFRRIEGYLQHPRLLTDSGANSHYTELTLWAMELTLAGALPLPNTYAICPNPEEPNLVSGHYCGGGYWASLFYTRGLPRLAPMFLR